MTKAARADGHSLEFDIPFDQLGFLGTPFKEARTPHRLPLPVVFCVPFPIEVLHVCHDVPVVHGVVDWAAL